MQGKNLRFYIIGVEPISSALQLRCIPDLGGPLHRRGGIASKLMRAVQCHTILGQEIAMESIAFSTPTDDGRALARKLTGLDNFLTYDQ